MTDYHKFDDIRPYRDEEIPAAMQRIASNNSFPLVARFVFPELPVEQAADKIRNIKTIYDFQHDVMIPMNKQVLEGTITEFSLGGIEKLDTSKRYLYVSNHRDIVLDSAFLDYHLLLSGMKSVEIGIGNNLLIHPWIETLVRLNRSFVVNRSATATELLESSKQLSRYIRFVSEEKKSPVWLAQREGRAKDSDDRTQKSVLKMLAMSGDDSMTLSEKLQSLHICPLTISYEYDPCDWLKATEFQMKRDNPGFRKSKQDDLINMKTGIWGFKGHMHYHVAAPIDSEIAALDTSVPRNQFLDQVAQIIDRHIFEGYRIYPCNRIALDMLRGDNAESANYTPDQKREFENYLEGQLKKIRIPNPDWDFLKERILTMYANPLINRKSVMQ